MIRLPGKAKEPKDVEQLWRNGLKHDGLPLSIFFYKTRSLSNASNNQAEQVD